MSKRRDEEFLWDIREAIERIERYIAGMDYEGFVDDIKTQDAVVRNLEIIGEAIKNLTFSLRKKYSKVDWKDFTGLRDKIIHFYFGIKWDIVWSIIKDKLPSLKKNIKSILKHINRDR